MASFQADVDISTVRNDFSVNQGYNAVDHEEQEEEEKAQGKYIHWVDPETGVKVKKSINSIRQEVKRNPHPDAPRPAPPEDQPTSGGWKPTSTPRLKHIDQQKARKIRVQSGVRPPIHFWEWKKAKKSIRRSRLEMAQEEEARKTKELTPKIPARRRSIWSLGSDGSDGDNAADDETSFLNPREEPPDYITSAWGVSDKWADEIDALVEKSSQATPKNMNVESMLKAFQKIDKVYEKGKTSRNDGILFMRRAMVKAQRELVKERQARQTAVERLRKLLPADVYMVVCAVMSSEQSAADEVLELYQRRFEAVNVVAEIAEKEIDVARVVLHAVPALVGNAEDKIEQQQKQLERYRKAAGMKMDRYVQTDHRSTAEQLEQDRQDVIDRLLKVDNEATVRAAITATNEFHSLAEESNALFRHLENESAEGQKILVDGFKYQKKVALAEKRNNLLYEDETPSPSKLTKYGAPEKVVQETQTDISGQIVSTLRLDTPDTGTHEDSGVDHRSNGVLSPDLHSVRSTPEPSPARKKGSAKKGKKKK